MKSAGKAPSRVQIPLSSPTISAVQGSQSVEIDISDVALAPGEGPPPIPLRGGGDISKDAMVSPDVNRQDHRMSESTTNSAGNQGLSARGSNSQVEEISPWNFQDTDGGGSWSTSRSRQVSIYN